ncbi:MAG: hypothetical protein NC548_56055 [Lachnospiraceae bacterium]|nr:hypothetical protein [Lachnospiraceae bacterium]
MKKILIMSAVAVCVSTNGLGANITTCPDCYKCVKYSGKSCVQCEYDENYCALVEHVCVEPQTWCASENQCTCPMLCSDSAVACAGTVNPTTCKCDSFAVAECLYGQYRDGLECLDCPEYSSSVTTACTPESRGGDSITSCYYPQGCEFTDVPGTFVFTSDCNYSIDSSDSAGSGSSSAESGEKIEIGDSTEIQWP